MEYEPVMNLDGRKAGHFNASQADKDIPSDQRAAKSRFADPGNRCRCNTAGNKQPQLSEV